MFSSCFKSTLIGLLSSTLAACETFANHPAALSASPADTLATMRAPSTDVLSVVAWGMAVVMGALVLAFVAKLLNGRGSPTRTESGQAGSKT